MRYVVCFGSGRLRRYLARPDAEGSRAKGWRPFTWTKDIARAEKFGSPEKACAFAAEHLPHDQWDVGVAPPHGLPTDDLGGTPAAVRMAA
ncbi:hypothetical protein [Methylobacterium sp. CCH5-D2]|uniref:hypothetical protein n=1 Tax=Methylobacterium sp. CCH5-D2 TaxID=1768765 RepID=UPI000836C006|nr:hypothetical protein [Methylobacterium sp. CCH5-D2]